MSPAGTRRLPPLPGDAPSPASSWVGRWLRGGVSVREGAASRTWPWSRVLWAGGVGYSSSLAYLPGIALVAAGVLAPVAVLLVVAVTLLGALPVYAAIARLSPDGRGAAAILENLLSGWRARVVVLGVLAFATLDFLLTITMSLSVAGARIATNPLAAPWLGGSGQLLAGVLLIALVIGFLRDRTPAMGLAAALVGPYVALSSVVLVAGAVEIAARPDLWVGWTTAVRAVGTPREVLHTAAMVVPLLAFGLSGFDTGVSVMPLLDAGPPGPATEEPPGAPAPRPPPSPKRIRGAQALLATLAVGVSALLLGAAVVTTVLVPAEALAPGGSAEGRPLAWLAHDRFGPVLGSLYDLVTVGTLLLAAAAAMAALLTRIPRALPRFGLAPAWVAYPRPLVLILATLAAAVLVVAEADPRAQADAYATGVLALLFASALAVVAATARSLRTGRLRTAALAGFGAVAVGFGGMLAAHAAVAPGGILLATGLGVGILLSGAASRYARATEFRVENVAFATAESEVLWDEMVGARVNLVTVKHRDAVVTRHKAKIKQHYQVHGAFAFIHVDLTEDRSAFDSTVYLRVSRVGDDYALRVTNAVAVPNTIAYLSELIGPSAIFLGLTRENPVAQAIRYLVWGEGETGILVYQILLRYWNRGDDDHAHPRLFLMSD